MIDNMLNDIDTSRIAFLTETSRLLLNLLTFSSFSHSHKINFIQKSHQVISFHHHQSGLNGLNEILYSEMWRRERLIETCIRSQVWDHGHWWLATEPSSPSPPYREGVAHCSWGSPWHRIDNTLGLQHILKPRKMYKEVIIPTPLGFTQLLPNQIW